MLQESKHQEIQLKAIQIIDKNLSMREKHKAICELLHNEIRHYDWVGFYMKDPNKDELVLGQFAGAPTDHKRIPFGVGICGQGAVQQRTINVQDVSTADNYLACSIDTKSELVVPIMDGSDFIGQIDVDSHTVNAFNIRDERLLEAICKRLAEYY